MADVRSHHALFEDNRPASRSESPPASTSDGSGERMRARLAQLAEAAREPVNSWLSSSPCAFTHGSDCSGCMRTGWSEDDCSPARHYRWDAARPSEPVLSTQPPAGFSFETHPVALCFRDRTVNRLYQDHRAASHCRTEGYFDAFNLAVWIIACVRCDTTAERAAACVVCGLIAGKVALRRKARRLYLHVQQAINAVFAVLVAWFACYAETHWDGIDSPVTPEPVPTWPRSLLLALVHAVPYMYHCRVVMLSCVWIFGRVGAAWLIPVQLSMVAMVLHKALPRTCTAERLAYGPVAVTVAALADAAQDVAAAVLPVPAADATLQTQCQRLHIFLYVICGLAIPFCASYVVERRTLAVFADQMRSQYATKGTAGKAGPSCTASPHADAQWWEPGDDGRCGTNSANMARCREDCPGGGAAPMLADVLVIGAWLPLVSVLTWHLIVWFL